MVWNHELQYIMAKALAIRCCIANYMTKLKESKF